MNLITSTIEEARVDEDHTLGGAADALCEVHSGSTLLIHNADFDGVTWQTEGVLDGAEQIHCHTDLIGAVHFGFYNVHGVGTRIAAFIGTS